MEDQWVSFFEEENKQDYFQGLQVFINNERKSYQVVPEEDQVFKAFELTKDKNIKIVILGQEPNRIPEKATGLAFSLPRGMKTDDYDSSLNMIFQALEADDVPFDIPEHGFLKRWARQGVLLLNSTLTYRGNEYNQNTHVDKGWDIFTQHVLEFLCESYSNLVFILWGQRAQAFSEHIVGNHLVLEGCHPAAPGYENNDLDPEDFIDEKFFSKANAYLVQNQKSPINWQI